MLTTLEKQLNETQRDALVSYYLGYIAPSKANDQPVSEEDLYEYLLIDTQVADEVETSRVAQAIASVQQYLYRLVMNSEKGHVPPDPSFVDNWRNNDSQYAIWAAGVQVQNYAENFISPVTRQEKSHYFANLESTLNQNQLNPDRVQDAVLTYLTQFEAVSNLYVVNGYIDQDEFQEAKYYFVGRTTTKPYQYYWRVMDLSKNEKEPASKPVTPNCWSDWLPINLPLSGETVLEHTVRPVYYNNRLHITWAERDPLPQKNKDGTNNDQHAYQIKFGYKRFDDTWTAPNTADLVDEKIQVTTRYLIDEPADFKLENVDTVSVVDFSRYPDGSGVANEEGCLFIGLFVYKEVNKDKDKDKESDKENNPDYYAYLYCDSSFNHRDLNPANRLFLFGKYKKNDNGLKKTLQYGVYQKKYKVEPAMHNDDKDVDNDENWLANLSDQIEVSIEKGYTLKITSNLKKEFNNIFVFSSDEQTFNTEYSCGFGLTHHPSDQKIVSLQYKDDDYYYFYDTAISYEPTIFGNQKGNPPAGSYELYAWDYADDDMGYRAISGEYSVSTNPAGTSDWLNISGREFCQAGRWIKQQYVQPTFMANRASGWLISGGLQKINNIEKIQNTKKYRHVLQLSWPTNEAGCTTSQSEGFTLSASDSFTQTHDIKASDFVAGAEQLLYTVDAGVWWKPCERNQATAGGTEGYVKRVFTVKVELADVNPHATLPAIVSRYDSTRGLVQYLAFNDLDNLPKDTRLNTTFVPTLIQQANLGIDSLLTYTLQATLLEANLSQDNQPEQMDFNGANGLYFWELFFHLPFLVAWRFANEQQYEPAQHWLHYIFDPARKTTDATKTPDYWNVYPLKPLGSAVSTPVYLLTDTLDPDAHAYAHPIIYQKAAFIAYVANLIAQGDAWYRQLTRDGLTAARIYYNQAAELLGARPDVTLVNRWQPAKLTDIAGALSQELRQYERQLGRRNVKLPALPGCNHGTLRLLDNANFIAPLNSMLLAHWDTLAARLYNLRHSLTLDGKPMFLALYETPANPLTLLEQRAQQGSLTTDVNGASYTIPPYRFRAILPSAYNAVATLSSFGETLLSLLERGEQARQQELQQQQLVELSSFAVTLQQQAIAGLTADYAALQANQSTAQQSHDHYYSLYQENISSGEQQVMDLHTDAQLALLATQPLQIAGGLASLAPNIFGMSDGGSDWGAPLAALAFGGTMLGESLNISADRLATTESYRRRREEWCLQYQQAQKEMDAIDKQLKALAVRKQAAQTALQQSQAQQQRLQAMLTFLKTRFTQATLYQWLSGQLSSLYYQAYDAVLSLCLSAQACWQYEIGEFSKTFIQTGAWNDHYRGLQVGQTLQLNLHQMEAAYLSRNERQLNVTRTVSLKALLAKTDKPFETQKAQGSFTFNLDEKLFDNDYPGHYLRQIQQISVTLPTLVGPYQDVKSVLTQTKSSTLLKADIEGVKYLNDPTSGKGDNVVNNLRPSQQVALSKGLNDTGGVDIQFDNERYLPFEGTGAVSSWTLTFPRAKDETIDSKTLKADPGQAALLVKLDDVLIQMQYTASDGGESFAGEVKKTLPLQ